MFKPSPEASRPVASTPVTFTFDGTPLQAAPEISVAAALFLHGVDACRDTPAGNVPRGPFCMMGVCYDCLVTIDGRPNQQACMTRVCEGMRITRQQGAREVQA
ncbi:(2Fe-2S)-binding protein [Bordetella tumulicola]|uniref:(2Fe-2S)-binding protein n=1 Tax=Bordetella tumulicola TaxID=1649133 RepID=UPI0039EFB881